MELKDIIVGLPWQLVKLKLQAASIPFTVKVGNNYNRFFEIANDGYYVSRVKEGNGQYEILLYRPLKNSNFELSNEVEYAKEFAWNKRQ